MKRKSIYLSILVSLFLGFSIWLFYLKSIELRREKVQNELQKQLLAYIEKEEIYPKKVDMLKFENLGLEVKYESLEDGRGCRFTIEGKAFELWDEER